MTVRSYKILLLCQSMSGGGVERSILNLLDAISAADKDIALGLWQYEGELLPEAMGHKIVCNNRSASRTPATRPFRLLFSVLHFVTSLPKIRRLLKQYQPDVLVTFSFQATIPVALIHRLLKRRGITWIVSEGSNTAESVKLVWDNTFFIQIYRRVVGWFFNRASCVVPVSKRVGQKVSQNYRIPAKKVKPIYNPINIAGITSKMLEDPEISIQGKYVLGVGRLVKVKGFDTLLSAFAGMSSARELRLVILGEGPERRNLEKLVESMGIGERVLLPGFVTNPWAYMKQAELVLVSSLYEGFCNTIAEAMAVGVPVISTACNYGPGEIIIDGQNGKLVPVGDAVAMRREMEVLLANDDLRKIYIREGLETAKRFSMEKIAQQYIDLFDSFVT